MWLTQLRRYTLFNAGGIAVFAMEVGITAFLTEIWGWWYMGSYTLALAITLTCMFFYHAYIVFEKHTETLGTMIRFIEVMLGNVVLAWILVLLLTRLLGFHYLPTIIGIAAVLNIPLYILSHKWVFKRPMFSPLQ